MLLGLYLGLLAVKKEKLILPKFVLFILDSFYLPLKKFAPHLGLKEDIVDQIGIQVRNKIHLKKFKKTLPNERILVFPQCLRHPDCPARLKSLGLICLSCGKCIISKIKAEAEKLGYRVFIVPGSSFVKRIVREFKPKGALGIACCQELNLTMLKTAEQKCSVQGVALLKEGCIETQVDISEILSKLKLGLEEFTPPKKPACETTESLSS